MELVRQGGTGMSGMRRILAWTVGPMIILLLPLVAIRFTDEVNWTAGDFVAAGIVLGGAGLAYALATRNAHGTARRLLTGLAVLAVVMLFWYRAVS